MDNKTVVYLSWKGSNYNEPCTVTNGPTGADTRIGSLIAIAGGRNGYGLNLVQYLVCPISKAIYCRTRTAYGSILWSDWSRIDNFGCSTPADLASLLGVYNYTQNLKYINTSFNAEQYVKIAIRSSQIDSQWQKKGVGEANFIICMSGYGYMWPCCKIQYPFTGYHAGSRIYFDNFNNAADWISEIQVTRYTSDNNNFIGNIYIKMSRSGTIKGWFESYAVSVVDTVSETAFVTQTSIELGRTTIAV